MSTVMKATVPGSLVLAEVSDGVGVIVLNRPERLNAITHALLVEFEAALAELGRRSDVGAIVLTGAGRAFCAGLDLEVGVADPAESDPVEAMYAGIRAGAAVTRAIAEADAPVIAAVRGHAVGAGFAFAAAADIRIVAPDARFSAPFLRLGMSAGDLGLSYFLPRIIGHGRAAHLIYSAGALTAEEAVAAGLAADIADDPLAAAKALASEIAKHPKYGTRLSKRLLGAGADSSLREHLDAEVSAQTLGALTGAARTAMAAASPVRRRREA
ncbi:enoyl-CoA hydratase/isomerase family protein [Nocardia sp. NPDC058176]|uniref:enoyl-CoA hydratase/isomerase family protein n=1 Tax=Nocardia sp. NPDC058176 TaxID=3346368 RepID=UPI0036D86556